MSRKKKKTKRPNKFWLLCIRNSSGIVLDIIAHRDYDILLLEGMDRAKEAKAFWEIYDAYGRYIDGNKN